MLVAAATGAWAQTLELSGAVFNAQHRLLYQGSTSERSAVMIGGHGAVTLGRIGLSLSGFQGSLGEAGPASPETKVRITSVVLTIRTTPWLSLGPEAEARRFEADAGVTTWVMLGATARLSLAMGGGLRGFGEVSLFPVAEAKPVGETMSPAFRAAVGISFSSPSGFEARIGYRLDRFDFSGSATASRLEQFRGLVAGVGWRLRR